MKFSELALNQKFSLRGDATRIGVKISEKTAFFYRENHVENVYHLKTVNPIPDISGRLARDRGGAICIVHEAGNGLITGYKVIPIEYIQGVTSDFDFLPGAPGESHREVYIILEKISQYSKKAESLVNAVKALLGE